MQVNKTHKPLKLEQQDKNKANQHLHNFWSKEKNKTLIIGCLESNNDATEKAQLM